MLDFAFAGILHGTSLELGHTIAPVPLRWRHNGHDGVSDHKPHHCLPNRLFGCRSKKTSKLRVTGLCAGNSPVTGEFPAQMASNAENDSIWWRHHDHRHRPKEYAKQHDCPTANAITRNYMSKIDRYHTTTQVTISCIFLECNLSFDKTFDETLDLIMLNMQWFPMHEWMCPTLTT